MNHVLTATAFATALTIALPVWAQTAFDGTYKGSLISAAHASSEAENLTKCWTSRPASITIQGGRVVMQYANWKGDVLHYRGMVSSSGAVNLRHTNGDGSIATLTGQISNGQITGNMRRGPCSWDLAARQ